MFKMETYQIALLILIALLGIPVGVLIAKHTKEELKKGKKWFMLISVFSAALFFISIFVFEGDERVLSLTTLAFVFTLSITSYLRAETLK